MIFILEFYMQSAVRVRLNISLPNKLSDHVQAQQSNKLTKSIGSRKWDLSQDWRKISGTDEKDKKSVCWYTPIILTLEWLKQGCGFKASLSYIGSNTLSPKNKVTTPHTHPQKTQSWLNRKVKMYRKGCLDSYQKVKTQVSICIEN